MVVHRTCHGKQLETESIYHLTDPPCSAHVLTCPGHIPRKTAMSPGGTGLSLPWLKAYKEVPAHRQGLGSHRAPEEQAPEMDWMKFIPAHQGTKWKEGTSDTRLPSFNSNNQNWLTEQATPSSWN